MTVAIQYTLKALLFFLLKASFSVLKVSSHFYWQNTYKRQNQISRKTCRFFLHHLILLKHFPKWKYIFFLIICEIAWKIHHMGVFPHKKIHQIFLTKSFPANCIGIFMRRAPKNLTESNTEFGFLCILPFGILSAHTCPVWSFPFKINLFSISQINRPLRDIY